MSPRPVGEEVPLRATLMVEHHPRVATSWTERPTPHRPVYCSARSRSQLDDQGDTSTTIAYTTRDARSSERLHGPDHPCTLTSRPTPARRRVTWAGSSRCTKPPSRTASGCWARAPQDQDRPPETERRHGRLSTPHRPQGHATPIDSTTPPTTGHRQKRTFQTGDSRYERPPMHHARPTAWEQRCESRFAQVVVGFVRFGAVVHGWSGSPIPVPAGEQWGQVERRGDEVVPARDVHPALHRGRHGRGLGVEPPVDQGAHPER